MRAAGLLVIADGKRGDIGSTARAYATAYLEPRDERAPLADALTVNTYLGGDSSSLPAGAACTERASSASCAPRTPARATSRSWCCPTGGASGSTWPSSWASGGLSDRRARLRVRRRRRRRDRPARGRRGQALLPRAVLLLPGVGAQGATAADVARAFTSGPASALVTASRSVISLPRRHRRLESRGGAEAARLRSEVWSVSGW